MPQIKLSKESERILAGLASIGKIDFKPVFKTISVSYRKEVLSGFKRKQPRLIEQRWKPLSDRYAEQKERDYPGQPLLVRTGRLRKSMTQKGASGNITVIGKVNAILGSSVPYGIFHDSEKPRKSNLPMRNFSEPSKRRLGIFTKQVNDYVIRVFEQNNIKVTKGFLA